MKYWNETERVPFKVDELDVLAQAVAISEEIISDHFKFSTSDWRRHRYDIRSLKDLLEEEVIDAAFAQIRRYARHPRERVRGSETGDYFKICLQDHVIRGATGRDPQIQLLPLTTYIVVHELIHVVRFARFLHSFLSTQAEQDAEERRVHMLTYQLLENRKIKGLPMVLAAFTDWRPMETFAWAIDEQGNRI
jgi:hypothetical protein